MSCPPRRPRRAPLPFSRSFSVVSVNGTPVLPYVTFFCVCESRLSRALTETSPAPAPSIWSMICCAPASSWRE